MADNPALVAAALGSKALFPIFIMDSSVWATGGKQHTSATEPEPETAVAYEKYIGARPRQFLIECLVALDKNLQSKFNSRLLIFRGDPATVLPHLVSQWGISHIYAEEEGVEPYWKLKDNAVEESLAAGGTGETVCEKSMIMINLQTSPMNLLILTDNSPSLSLSLSLSFFYLLYLRSGEIHQNSWSHSLSACRRGKGK